MGGNGVLLLLAAVLGFAALHFALRQRRLRDIWEDPGAFAYNRQFRREMLTGTCARCRMGPWCAGGCRSYNYFVHGKLYESPACAGGAK